MCKLSLNVAPNVYNSMQSSLLSLAWPWPGRSLPKGNQSEWWDPCQGPLPGLCELGHSTRGTSGSAGTLDWGPMWSGSQSTCHPNAPDTPYTPAKPMTYPTPYWPPTPQCPTPLTVWVLGPWTGAQCSQAPSPATTQCPLTPLHSLLAPWCPYTPATPQCPPDALTSPLTPDNPTPLLAAKCPLMPLYPCQWECCDPGLGPNVVGCQSTYHPQIPPETPYTPCTPDALHPCQWEC